MTIHNVIDYLVAIEEAVKRDIFTLPKSERSLILGVMSASIAKAAEDINKYRLQLEESGESLPVTEEQKEEVRALFRRAIAKDKPAS